MPYQLRPQGSLEENTGYWQTTYLAVGQQTIISQQTRDMPFTVMRIQGAEKPDQ